MRNNIFKVVIFFCVSFVTALSILHFWYDEGHTVELITVQTTCSHTNSDEPVRMTINTPTPTPPPMLKRGKLTEDLGHRLLVEHELITEEYVPTLEEVFYAELDLIPEEELDIILSSGWDIILTDEDFGYENGFDMSICGLTLYDDKTIYVSASNWAIRRSTIHEVGHALDYELGYPSDTKEFREIFEEEKYNFTDCTSIGDNHEISDVYEYFASVYQNMILDYEETAAEVPKTVNFIETLIYNKLYKEQPMIKEGDQRHVERCHYRDKQQEIRQQ